MSNVLPNVVLITNSTDVVHLVDENGTLCGRWNFEMEWLDYEYDFGMWGRDVNDYSCRVRRACDGATEGSLNARVCSQCDNQVDDDTYRDLFDTTQFAHIEGINIGEYDSRHMGKEQWQIYRSVMGI